MERQTRRRNAKVLVLTILVMPIMLGAAAVAVDLGMIVAIQSKLRTAADAGALAGARLLNSSGQDVGGVAKAAATTFATSNGYSHSGVNSTVTVHIPPTSGSFSGMAGYVEVIVAFSQPRIFSSIWGSGALPISARGVASSLPTAYSNSSVIVLDPSAAGALTVSGSGHVIATSSVQVNSSNSGAINANNKGYVQAPTIKVTGNYVTSSSGYLSGSVQTAAPSVVNPLSTLAAPSTSGLTTRGAVPTYGTFTMNPGIYNGGVNLVGGAIVTMNPGTYYMKGGGFSVSNGVTLTGTGVTIYVDSAGGTFSFQGGGVINLSAPTTGTYAGVVMYLDPASTQNISIANGSTTNISGTFYAPNSQISFAGGATASAWGSQLIAKKLNISNNADIRVNWGTTTVARKGSLGLVE